MKNITISLLLLVLLLIKPSGLIAQYTDGPISIENIRTEVSSEMLHIHFTVLASGLSLKCDGQLKLEFAVENEERRLLLPGGYLFRKTPQSL